MAYSQLVQERKVCTRCEGLKNPASCCNGEYDTDQIGPWSVWQGDLDAKLMLVGQDWGGERYFVTNKGRDTDGNPTNKTLGMLLATIGFETSGPSQSRPTPSLFFTNAILCLKQGGLEAPVRDEWFTNCRYFLQRTIDIVRPAVLVTLGEKAYRAVCSVYELPKLPFKDAVEATDGFPLIAGTKLFPVYHCGAKIQNMIRSIERQKEDWKRIAAALSR